MFFIIVFLLLSVGTSQTFRLFSFSSKVDLNSRCSNPFTTMEFTYTSNGVEVTHHTRNYCSGNFVDVSTPTSVVTLKNISCNSAQPVSCSYYDFYGDIHCLFEPSTPNNSSNFCPPNLCIFGSQCFNQPQPNNWLMNTCVYYPKSGGIEL